MLLDSSFDSSNDNRSSDEGSLSDKSAPSVSVDLCAITAPLSYADVEDSPEVYTYGYTGEVLTI